MKEIKAVIRQQKLDNVLNALHKIGGLPSVVSSQAQVTDVGAEFFRSETMAKIELMVPDDQVEAVIGLIAQAAHTGNAGDGRIFVIPVEESVVIRSGERGEDAR
jgi:nitrogen regulatory protein P-II 1